MPQEGLGQHRHCLLQACILGKGWQREQSFQGLEQELGSIEGGPQYCAVCLSDVGAGSRLGLGEKRQEGPSFWFQAEIKGGEMCP